MFFTTSTLQTCSWLFLLFFFSFVYLSFDLTSCLFLPSTSKTPAFTLIWLPGRLMSMQQKSGTVICIDCRLLLTLKTGSKFIKWSKQREECLESLHELAENENMPQWFYSSDDVSLYAVAMRDGIRVGTWHPDQIFSPVSSYKICYSKMARVFRIAITIIR